MRDYLLWRGATACLSSLVYVHDAASNQREVYVHLPEPRLEDITAFTSASERMPTATDVHEWVDFAV